MPTKREWFIREGPWKWVVDRDHGKLYHLPSDPEEAHDLSGRRPLVVGYLRRLLWENSRVLRESDYQSLALDYGLDESEQKRLNDALKALGYVE